MRLGSKVFINLNSISDTLKDTLSSYQKYNEATVTRYRKVSQRVQIKWNGQYPLWFDKDQLIKS